MSEAFSSVQRSFRLSADTSQLLDRRVSESEESRNAIVDRLLNESLRLEKHPFVRFVTGASGRREPHIIGTRWKVRQIIATLQAENGQISEVIKNFDVTEVQVRAAVSYYAEFGREIDVETERDLRDADQQRAQWEREQSMIV